MSELNSLSSLLTCAARAFVNHNSQIGSDAHAALIAASTLPVVKEAHSVDQCKTLEVAYRQNDNPLNKEIERLEHQLHWSDTGAVMKPDNIQRHLAFTELVGPNGMINNDHCKVGLLFQSKNALYPNHRHAAEELYLVVSGTALWSQSNSELAPRSPGEFIHHVSWQPHAMKTTNEPLLTMWCWTGDISYDSYEML